jgi:ParB-like chromosome segregation protein Spo0J
VEDIECIVRGPIDDIEAKVLNLAENLDRKDLNILQEAKAIESLEHLGLNRDEIAQKTGQSHGWVQVRLYLLQLPPDVQKEAASGILGQHHVRDLYSMRNNQAEMYEAVRKIKDAKLRGQSIQRVRPKTESPDKKRQRDSAEVYKLICHILENVGPCLATRALAWRNGEITDLDMFQSIKDECKKLGREYVIPSLAISNLQEK